MQHEFHCTEILIYNTHHSREIVPFFYFRFARNPRSSSFQLQSNYKQKLHSCHSIVWLLIQCEIIMIRKILKLQSFTNNRKEQCVSKKITYELWKKKFSLSTVITYACFKWSLLRQLLQRTVTGTTTTFQRQNNRWDDDISK